MKGDGSLLRSLFSREPEQLHLFPNLARPARPNTISLLLDALPSSLVLIVLTFTGTYFISAAVKIFSPQSRRVLFPLDTIIFNAPDLFWLVLLAIALLTLYLPPPKILNTPKIYKFLTKLAVWSSLIVYFFEVFKITWRFLTFSAPVRAPWSLLVITVGVVFLVLWKLPQKQLAPWKEKLEVKDYLTIINSTRTFLLQVVGGGIVVIGLYYTSQTISISQENVRLNLLQQETARLNQAIVQLKDENPEVRLVAIYNLQKLASQSFENYKLIGNILARYVRTHAAWSDIHERTVIDGIEPPDDIQAILTFLGDRYTLNAVLINEYEQKPWMRGTDPREFLTTIVIGEKPNFRATDLRRTRLERADMRNWFLQSAHLEGASLASAVLESTDLENANLSFVDLSGAKLVNANLKNVIFNGTNLSNADLRGADIEGADFTNAVNITPEMIAIAENPDKAKLPPNFASTFK